MFNLQKALDDRLAILKNNKNSPNKQSIQYSYNSNECIEKSLKQAGILDKNGKMIKRVAA